MATCPMGITAAENEDPSSGVIVTSDAQIMTVRPVVHILGPGSIGGLVAHSLANTAKDALSVTLLLRNISKVHEFAANGGALTVNRGSVLFPGSPIERSIQIPATCSSQLSYTSPKIDYLVVTTKAQQTISALEPYVPLLGPSSTVLVLQNGMGVLEQVLERYWPSVVRPNIYMGTTTHGVHPAGKFSYNHVGPGMITIAKVPRDYHITSAEGSNADKPISEEEEAQSDNLLISKLLSCAPLNVVETDFQKLLLVQAEKLIVNACVNPLTAVLDCYNGELLHSKQFQNLSRKIIKEASTVFKKATEPVTAIVKDPKSGMETEVNYPPLFADSIMVQEVFNPDRLQNVVNQVIKLTASNSSSMRQDVRNAVEEIEVNYINGYLVSLGQRYGYPCYVNMTVMQMVLAQLEINKHRIDAL